MRNYCRKWCTGAAGTVIDENARVEDAREALEGGDPESFGRLMNESHRSLQEDYEVSSTELDLLVGIACGIAGVYGLRMTWAADSGGCTISLVRRGAVEEFSECRGARARASVNGAEAGHLYSARHRRCARGAGTGYARPRRPGQAINFEGVTWRSFEFAETTRHLGD